MKTTADYEKMTPFERIREGLKQSIAHSRGEISLRSTTLPRPVPHLSNRRVVSIRKKAGMTQSMLAAYLNVPKRTVESWEQGRRAAKASEARMLQLLEIDAGLICQLVHRGDEISNRRQVKSRRKAA